MSFVSPGAGALVAVKPGHPRRGVSQAVYQIDFTAVASGKRIANTKRRVRWRFGFTNLEALENGETGTACRGEEHDITLVWSITSGKRLVLADGQEVHYSNSRSSVFEFSWTMRGNHVLKLIAHASPPIGASTGFRQYDFFVDGQSFFTFPKVYRLGLSGKEARNAEMNSSPPAIADRSQPYKNYDVGGVGVGVGAGGVGRRSESASDIVAIEAPHNQDEEEAYLAEAIKNSLQESSPPKSNDSSFAKQPSLPPVSEQQPKQQEEADLLDFFSDPAPAPATAAPAAATALLTNYASTTAAPFSDANDMFPIFGAPSPATSAPAPAYAQPPRPPQPQPAPTSTFSQPSMPDFAQVPVPSAAPPVTNQAYVTTPFDSVVHKPAEPNFTQPSNGSYKQETDPFSASMISEPNQMSQRNSYSSSTPNAVNLSFGSEKQATAPGNAVDQAVQKLMNGFSLDANESLKQTVKANPFDKPTQSGPQPTLAGLQNSKPQTTKKEVMNSPPPGAMVVSTNQSGNWSGYGMGPGYGQRPMNNPMAYGGHYSGAGAPGGYNVMQGSYNAQTNQQYPAQYQQPPQQQFQQQQYQQPPAYGSPQFQRNF